MPERRCPILLTCCFSVEVAKQLPVISFKCFECPPDIQQNGKDSSCESLEPRANCGRTDKVNARAPDQSQKVPSLGIEKLKPEEWNNAIALNLTSVFLCSQAVSQHMIAQKHGSIINISSVAGIRLSPAFVHYGAAKAGVINLTKSLAVCWGPHNINVNCIAPGLTATEGVSQWLPSRNREDGSPVPPLEYPPDPEHVAELATFLASRSSSHISGELFPIRALTELA